MEAEIARQIKTIDDFAEQAARLVSAPGVGPVTALALIAHMPELGQTSPKAIASLAGLAPFNNDSGARRGKRAIRGGRPRVRKALYMAALGAIRASARFKAFYAVIAARSGSKNSPSSPSPESSSPFSTPCNATTNHTLETQLQEPRPIRGTPGRADDRAWVEAELKDVGDQALMRARGLATAFPIVRPGLFLSYCGHRSICRPQSS